MASVSERIASVERDLRHLEQERDRAAKTIETMIASHADSMERVVGEHSKALTAMHSKSLEMMTTETNRWVQSFRYFIIAVLALNGTLLAGSKAGTILGSFIEGVLK